MKKTLSMLAIMSVILVSCEKNGEDNPKEYSISVSPTELTFGAEGGEQIVTVTSSEYWSFKIESDWCSVRYYGESSASITVTPNDDAENPRVITILFTCGDKTTELTVIQQQDEVIEFKDLRFLQAILQNNDIDKNGDEKISKSEAASCIYLNVNASSIRVLDEIKYFIALTRLDCFGNELTSIDLSNNIPLQILHCGSNQLKTLDISNNPFLSDLECYDNQLTSLDVSKNNVLTNLSCGNNQLTSLDVSKNPLRRLNCQNNQLTSLDVSKNTALTSLGCRYNQLTSLDLSNNTALTGLGCSRNQLTSLDLSNNTALTSLTCDYNQLTSLDLSKNTALTQLNCHNNPLKKIILYKYHIIGENYMEVIESQYGDIIEYAE